MRVLVTGKDGQLGKSIQNIVNSQGLNGFIFSSRKELDLSLKYNIDDYFYTKDKFDIIINCAAYTAVDKAEQEVELANQINHSAVRQLAEIAVKQNTKLIHISTDYVFDGKSNRPYIESDAPNPINIYGKTKLAGEQAIQEIMKTNALIIRTSWVYSEHKSNFVKTILELGSHRIELNVVSDQVGSPTNANDLAKDILKIISKKHYLHQEQSTEIYHYSNKGAISRYQFALKLFEIAKIDCKINPATTAQFPTIARRPLNTVLNQKKIELKYKLKILDWMVSYRKLNRQTKEIGTS